MFKFGRKPKNKNKIAMNIKVDENLFKMIEEKAFCYNCSLSEVVRMAIKNFLGIKEN